MFKSIIVAAALAATALTATSALAASKSIELKDGKATVRTIGTAPRDLLGIPYTTNVHNGNTVTVMASYPSDARMMGEWHPLRVVYSAHAMNVVTGQEYSAYALYAGFANCDDHPDLTVVIDGVKTLDPNIKVILLSTQADIAFNLVGKEVQGFNPKTFRASKAARAAIMAAQGTALGSTQAVSDMNEALGQWNVYPDAKKVSPLSEEEATFLGTINPQYSLGQKFGGTFRGSISPDLVSTAFGLGFDVAGALFAKSKGFDFKSVLTRQEMGAHMAVFQAQRNESLDTCRAYQVAGR